MLDSSFYELGYLNQALSLDDLKWAVQNGDLTAEKYKEITGQDYTA